MVKNTNNDDVFCIHTRDRSFLGGEDPEKGGGEGQPDQLRATLVWSNSIT